MFTDISRLGLQLRLFNIWKNSILRCGFYFYLTAWECRIINFLLNWFQLTFTQVRLITLAFVDNFIQLMKGLYFSHTLSTFTQWDNNGGVSSLPFPRPPKKSNIYFFFQLVIDLFVFYLFDYFYFYCLYLMQRDIEIYGFRSRRVDIPREVMDHQPFDNVTAERIKNYYIPPPLC